MYVKLLKDDSSLGEDVTLEEEKHYFIFKACLTALSLSLLFSCLSVLVLAMNSSTIH